MLLLEFDVADWKRSRGWKR